MPHPILPRIVPDNKRNKVQQFKVVGQWERRSAEEVKAVADALDVPDRDVEIQSVPDIWARPLYFESALLSDPGTDDAKTKRSKSVESEWRGLLAILALRDRRFIKGLEFQPVFTAGPQTKFLEVAERLLPDQLIDRSKGTDWERVSIHRQTGWRDVSVILLNKEVIGLTSPTTLVCTAPGHRKDSAFSSVEWYNRDTGRLQDPLPVLHPDEQRALAYWIEYIQKYLNDSGCAGPKFSRLSKALLTFKRSLVGEDVRLTEFSTSHGAPVAGTALFMLGTPVASKEETGKCEVELKHFRPKAPAARAIVLDEDLPRQWRRSATDIGVLSSVPLQAALHAIDPKNRDVVHGIPLGGGHWYTAEDFFTSKLYLFTRGGAIPGALSVPGQAQIRYRDKFNQEKQTSVILPIKKKWLDWFTSEELARRISFSPQGVDVDVYLTLPLSGGDLTIGRRYPQSAIQNCGDQLPVTKIWPFLNTPNWKVYYTYYDNFGEENVYLQPYVFEQTAKPKPIPVIRSSKEHRAEVSKTAAYPEAMTATIGDAEAGLILLQPPFFSPASGQEWKVGIDFGTTGTTVFAASGMAAEGHPLQFEPRLQSITMEERNFESLTYRRFAPSKVEDGGSLLSIFHDFNSPLPDQSNVIQPLTEGRICFIQDTEQFKASEPGISTNMKWGNDHDRARGRAFLHQLALQSAAEAAAAGATSISWRFSFPTAFSDRELGAFGKIWEEIIERCAAETGIRPRMHDGNPFKRKNESIATAHAFRKTDKAGPQPGAVFVDIGGGTTDLAIWQGNKPINQASFRFAGRDIFLHPIFLRPSLLKVFGRNVSKLEEVRNTDEYIFHSQVDVMLRGKNSSELLSQLPILANDTNAVVLEFLDLLQLGIAGILHYIGLSLKALEEAGRYKRFMPNIYIGGNGSKILHWMGIGAFKANSPADRMLKTVFARATGFSELGKSPFEIRISRMPKSEVAQGLVLDYDLKQDPDEEEVDLFEEEQTDPPLLAGEDYLYDGAPKGWNTYIETKTDPSKIEISPDLPQLHALLQVLKIPADPSQFRQCAMEVNQAMADMTQEEKERHVEPLFITALRALHRQRSEEWANSPLSPQEK